MATVASWLLGKSRNSYPFESISTQLFKELSVIPRKICTALLRFVDLRCAIILGLALTHNPADQEIRLDSVCTHGEGSPGSINPKKIHRFGILLFSYGRCAKRNALQRLQTA
jgi:hypothetical protein